MEEIRFKINSEEKEYTLDDCPVDITHVNYIVFPILNKEITIYSPSIIDNYSPIKEQLENIQTLAYEENDLSKLNISDIYNDIDDENEIIDWMANDDEFWEIYFDDNPQEAARATYFGDIRNWNDPYIRFNAYGNLETTYKIDYEPYEDEILEEWLNQHL
ncbi:MAG: hypothetical protein D8H99_13345 [Streptococcus sp.]|nr:MAG: hypothetical protein D8H99_13345 [Streptococcus sp.]